MVPRRLRGTQSDPRLRGDKFCQRGCGLRPVQCGNGALAGLREAPLPTLIWGPLKGYCGPKAGFLKVRTTPVSQQVCVINGNTHPEHIASGPPR